MPNALRCLTAVRTSAALTSTQLAAAAGVSRAALAAWECGVRTPSPNALRLLCDALSRTLGRAVTIDDLR